MNYIFYLKQQVILYILGTLSSETIYGPYIELANIKAAIACEMLGAVTTEPV